MTAVFLLNYILLCVIAYLIGSIPFSYFILKSKRKIDITKEGSGNAGAMNSYEVSGSKQIGIIVLMLDALKGFIPAFILGKYLMLDLTLMMVPALMIIIGHNFSIWLGFKGGRGLATAAGLAVYINFWFLIIWLSLFGIFYLIKRDIHIGNIFATILMPVIVLITRDIIIKFTYDYGWGRDTANMLFPYIAVVSFLILFKHIEPMSFLIKKYRKKNAS